MRASGTVFSTSKQKPLAVSPVLLPGMKRQRWWLQPGQPEDKRHYRKDGEGQTEPGSLMVSLIHYWLVTNLLQQLPTFSPLYSENASPHCLYHYRPIFCNLPPDTHLNNTALYSIQELLCKLFIPFLQCLWGVHFHI